MTMQNTVFDALVSDRKRTAEQVDALALEQSILRGVLEHYDAIIRSAVRESRPKLQKRAYTKTSDGKNFTQVVIDMVANSEGNITTATLIDSLKSLKLVGPNDIKANTYAQIHTALARYAKQENAKVRWVAPGTWAATSISA